MGDRRVRPRRRRFCGYARLKKLRGKGRGHVQVKSNRGKDEGREKRKLSLGPGQGRLAGILQEVNDNPPKTVKKKGKTGDLQAEGRRGGVKGEGWGSSLNMATGKPLSGRPRPTALLGLDLVGTSSMTGKTKVVQGKEKNGDLIFNVVGIPRSGELRLLAEG